MHDFKKLAVLSALTLLLAGGVITAAAFNSYALIGLAPVLFAIAAIVRAVAGGRHEDDDRKNGNRDRTKQK